MMTKQTNNPFLAAEPATDNTSRLRVLVIEDTPAFAAEALKLPNCEVKTAATLAQALEAMDGFKPDIVLSDVHFPTREGEAPKAQTREVIDACLWHALPFAFVTRVGGAHTNLQERGEGNRIAILAMTPGQAMNTLIHVDMWIMATTKVKQRVDDMDNTALFQSLYSCKMNFDAAFAEMPEAKDALNIGKLEIYGKNVKTLGVWNEALQMTQNNIAKTQISERLTQFNNSVLKAKANGGGFAFNLECWGREQKTPPRTLVLK